MKTYKYIITSIFSLLLSSYALASYVPSELLIIENDTFDIDKSSICELSDIFGDTNLCVANLQYVMTWKVIDDKLFLIDIGDIMLMSCGGFMDSLSQNTLNVLNKFNNKSPEFKGLFASWVSKSISIHYGGFIPFKRMGSLVPNYSKYEKLLSFNQGELIQVKTYENLDANSQGLSIYNKQSLDSIITIINLGLDWDSLNNNNLESYLVIYRFSISKNGQTTVMLLDDNEGKNAEKTDFGYLKELNQLLDEVTWQIILKRGVPIDIDLIFDLKFDFNKRMVINPYLEK